MSVFDIEKDNGACLKGYVIHVDENSSKYNIFIKDIDDTNIYVSNNQNFIAMNSLIINKIVNTGLTEERSITPIENVRLDGDEELDFRGLTVENQTDIIFSNARNAHLIIKNFVLRGIQNNSTLSLVYAGHYELENVCVENQSQIFWSPSTTIKNSNISCDVFRVSPGTGTTGYSKIKKMAEKDDFKGIKEYLNLPLDCVKFNKITVGRKSLTREQYENL